MPDAIDTLPELLQPRFQTVASVSAFVTTRIWNLDQGFDVYYDELAQQGPLVTERFAERLWTIYLVVDYRAQPCAPALFGPLRSTPPHITQKDTNPSKHLRCRDAYG